MAMTQNGVLKRDDNDSPVMGGTSSSDNATIINAAFDPVTRRLLTDSASGSGTVTSVSVVTANGFAGTVADATTTPAITLTTTINSPILAGNGTALIAATTTGSGSTAVLNNSPTFVDDITIGTASTATGSILFKGLTSGTVTLSVADVAGTWTMKLPTTDGDAGQFLQTDGSGNTTWAASSVAAGGNNTEVQYNNAGALGGITNATSNGTTLTITSGRATTDFSPSSNDGAALGTTALGFSDLHLATGGVINWANGEITITESDANTLTVAGGTLAVSGAITGTSSLALGAAAGTTGSLVLTGTTSGAVTLSVADAAGTWTMKLPTTDGNANEFLQTDGSGNTTWAAGSSIPATTITVANEATDTTCFPLFVTAATGDLGPKSNTGLTYNSNTNDLGVTKINGLTLTASTGTFTLTNAKTLSVTNSLTLSGTDSTTMTFPSTTATIARTDAAQTFTGTQTFSQVITTANAITATGNAATIPVTSRHNIVTNNSAATLTITLTTASAVNMQTVVVQILDASAAAQTITWVNTEDSTVTAPTTSNGSTTLPLTVGFMYNSATSKWRCIAKA